jgi:hypothetical protein
VIGHSRISEPASLGLDEPLDLGDGEAGLNETLSVA